MADENSTGNTLAAAQPPAGYIAESDVQAKLAEKDAFLKTEIERRLRGKVDPEKLLQDETFRAKALETWGIKPEKPGKPSGEDVEKLYGQWEAKHVAPLKAQMAQFEAEVTELRTRDLYGQIVGAAAPLVNEQLLQSPVPGQAPPIVHLLAPYFGYDPEHKAWFVKDGDGFAFAAKPEKGAPYKTAAEFLGEWAQNKANAAWVKDQRQRGAGFQQAATGAATIKSRADFKSDGEKASFIRDHGLEAFQKLPAK